MDDRGSKPSSVLLTTKSPPHRSVSGPPIAIAIIRTLLTRLVTAKSVKWEIPDERFSRRSSRVPLGVWARRYGPNGDRKAVLCHQAVAVEFSTNYQFAIPTLRQP
jgi:hypothetical protein